MERNDYLRVKSDALRDAAIHEACEIAFAEEGDAGLAKAGRLALECGLSLPTPVIERLLRLAAPHRPIIELDE